MKTFKYPENERLIFALTELIKLGKYSNFSDIARKSGVSPQDFTDIKSCKKRIQRDFLEKLSSRIGITVDYVLLGKGAMYNDNLDINTQPTNVFISRSDHPVDSQSIPLYNIQGTAGLVPLFDGSKTVKTNEYIQIPNLPKCDGAIYVTGDSMYPLLKSGDIVLYKQIYDIENGIFFGEMYLISISMDDEEYITVKYIQKSNKEGHVKLVSQNQHHDPKDIPVKQIRALALIKASIRINSIR